MFELRQSATDKVIPFLLVSSTDGTGEPQLAIFHAKIREDQ